MYYLAQIGQWTCDSGESRATAIDRSRDLLRASDNPHDADGPAFTFPICDCRNCTAEAPWARYMPWRLHLEGAMFVARTRGCERGFPAAREAHHA